jgi:hypothetical protein
MHFKLRLIPAATAAMLLAACGGGSNSSGGTNPTPSSGVAVDGYLQFSKVVCDANSNGLADTGETVVYTTSAGTFTFPNGCTHGVIVSGGRSADTQLTFGGLLKAPAGATVASPLTTLMSAGMSQTEITTALGLPANTDLLKTDPAAVTSSGALVNPDLLKKTLAVQQLLQKVTETYVGLTTLVGSATLEPIYNEVAAAFASAMKSGTPLVTAAGIDADRVKTMVAAAGERVKNSTSVMAEVKTAITNAGGSATLAAVTSAALSSQADAYVKASDDATTITSVTKDRQSNETIKTSVKAAVDTGTLTSTSKETDAGVTQLATTTKTEADKTTNNSTTPSNPKGTLLVSFDEATPVFTGMGAYGGALPEVVAGPTGGSVNALKIVKPTSKDIWGGTFFGVPAIPFTATRKTLSARVYATRSGAVIKLKVESANGGPAIEIASAPTGAANTWQTVSWEMAGVDESKAYTTMAITPDADVVTSGQAYYIDEITLADAVLDTQAPTLSITDNISANTANGAVTFNFTFSEDVGSSFAASDISVTGGALGALNKTDSKHYSAVVTPASNTTGSITVNVAAGSFQDVSNNSNTAAATAAQAFDTTSASVAQDTVLLTFDEATPLFTGMGAYGGALPSVEAGPTGGSANALKIVKPTGALDGNTVVPWGGTYFGVPAIPFTATRKTLTAKVYATRSGAVIKLKVESANGGPAIEIVSAPTGAANTWQTVSWEMVGVDASKAYTTMAITPDAELVTSGQSYYFDNITLAAAPVVTADTTAPTLAITDNVTANTATGPVTFNFTFSEDVGSSFTAADITPAGGTLGAFTRLSATQYSAVVTPTANSSGNATVTVAAGAFADLANNSNAAATTASQAFDTTVPAAPTNYLYLTNNGLSLTDGVTTTSYTMDQFQSTTGIDVQWPMASTAAIKLNLAEQGTFAMAANQTLTAAVSITQVTPTGQGEVRAFIKNVSITKTGSNITITVPAIAEAMVYGVSGDGTKKAVISFANSVASVTNTLTSAANAVSTIVLGDVVNYAVNGVSNDFSGIYALTGKYKVSIVVTELPLRQADGTAFPTVPQIDVPTAIDSSGAIVTSSIVPVLGTGLVGYINLVK